MRPSRSAGRVRVFLSALTAMLLAVGMLAVGAPAYADLGDNGQITLDKNVDGAAEITTQPGGSFTYNLVVGCDDNPCIDAVLTDPLPAEFAGFTINNLQTNPPSAAIDAQLTGCAVGGPLVDPCTLDVAFLTPLGTLAGVEQVGIPAGTTYRVSLTLTVPSDLTPAWPHRNTAVDNTATADAATTMVHNVQDTARVTVDVPITVDVAASKSWSPGSQLYNPGQHATFQIGARNVSNVDAETLVLQDPVVAPDNAAGELDANNPFTFVDFVGLCTLRASGRGRPGAGRPLRTRQRERPVALDLRRARGDPHAADAHRRRGGRHPLHLLLQRHGCPHRGERHRGHRVRRGRAAHHQPQHRRWPGGHRCDGQQHRRRHRAGSGCGSREPYGVRGPADRAAQRARHARQDHHAG
ncbi:hypothetical protein [Homoserinibacter gongjuensis]|uniref:hypothetical protein n=1 Tax=Homoserinibacter gongjuensis TaxID=1162968 RepID=UPI0024E0BF36|nr:hypothetical protein [Homoserinibacter gongjuensis]